MLGATDRVVGRIVGHRIVGLFVACLLLVIPPALDLSAWPVDLESAYAEEGAGGPDLLRTPGPKDQYRRVVAAWESRKAPGVVGEMHERSTLSLQLLKPKVSGTYRRAQAQHTLQRYFQGVSDVALKDVTPKRYPTRRGWAVRFFDYTYRPHGQDPVKTQLKITMKGDGRGNWYLNRVEESPKR